MIRRFNHLIYCTPPYLLEQPKIRSIREVKEFIGILSEKGYNIYPEKTSADFCRDYKNHSSPITKINDNDIKPGKVVIKGENLEIVLRPYCSADNKRDSGASRPYTAGIKCRIRITAKDIDKVPEIEHLVKNYWKLRKLSEIEI